MWGLKTDGKFERNQIISRNGSFCWLSNFQYKEKKEKEEKEEEELRERKGNYTKFGYVKYCIKLKLIIANL